MDEFDLKVFAELVKAVYATCFGHPLVSPMSESEGKHLSSEIEEQTGLTIGWKSLKNYVAFVLSETPGRQENPSMATLDTLARYVLAAPAISEAQRRKTANHFPYWFRYRDQFKPPVSTEKQSQKSRFGTVALVAIGLLVAVSLYVWYFRQPALVDITEKFQSVDDNYLAQHGWFVQAKDAQFWQRRTEHPSQLTLFTLKGDNWPQSGEKPVIRNLVLRPVQNECFTTEMHLTDFIPEGNWQQAGLLLLEDTTFTGKSIRLSLTYNNFFGGYTRPGEILIQATASTGPKEANLEEFIHQPLFGGSEPVERPIIANNLKYFAFRIEKQSNRFRFLYSASPVDNFAFKEVATYDFAMQPRFVGLFALKGFVDTTAVKPVAIRFFRLKGLECP